MPDSLGAFVTHSNVRIEGRTGGPLSGLAFAAKDIFDVAGERTGAGNPAWLDTHPPASRNAWAVQALLDAGATLAGKTLTEELAYGMTGRNTHYGTPINAGAPDRLPGGSSNGSASAVSGKLVDFALGSDTGGSIRVPASYCGIFGLRPTHGRISTAGVVDLAPSFDTVGWLSRDASLLGRVGEVLLGADSKRLAFRRVLRADDAFECAEPATVALLAPWLARVEKSLVPAERIRLCPTGLAAWAQVFRICSAREAWESDGAWIERVRPRFAPDVQARFDYARSLGDDEVAAARKARVEITAALLETVREDAVIALPSAPGPAPKRDTPMEELDAVRGRNLQLTCIAGLAGLPQVSIPAGRIDGGPVGFGLIGPRGSDRALLDLAVAVAG